MINKFVRCRVEHVCDTCKETINKGDEALYVSYKLARYKDFELDHLYDVQVGIEYTKLYICLKCEEELKEEKNIYNFDDE